MGQLPTFALKDSEFPEKWNTRTDKLQTLIEKAFEVFAKLA